VTPEGSILRTICKSGKTTLLRGGKEIYVTLRITATPSYFAKRFGWPRNGGPPSAARKGKIPDVKKGGENNADKPSIIARKKGPKVLGEGENSPATQKKLPWTQAPLLRKENKPGKKGRGGNFYAVEEKKARRAANSLPD